MSYPERGYGSPGHEQWLIEQEIEDERWSVFGQADYEREKWSDMAREAESDWREAEARADVQADQRIQAKRDAQAYSKEAYQATLVEIPCPRCGGTGVIPSFYHVENGVCFRCRGAGSVQVRPTSREYRQYTGELARDNRPAPRREGR